MHKPLTSIAHVWVPCHKGNHLFGTHRSLCCKAQKSRKSVAACSWHCNCYWYIAVSTKQHISHPLPEESRAKRNSKFTCSDVGRLTDANKWQPKVLLRFALNRQVCKASLDHGKPPHRHRRLFRPLTTRVRQTVSSNRSLPKNGNWPPYFVLHAVVILVGISGTTQEQSP